MDDPHDDVPLYIRQEDVYGYDDGHQWDTYDTIIAVLLLTALGALAYRIAVVIL